MCVYLCVYLSVYLSAFLSISQSICLSTYLSICLSSCLSVYLSMNRSRGVGYGDVPPKLAERLFDSWSSELVFLPVDLEAGALLVEVHACSLDAKLFNVFLRFLFQIRQS